MHDRSEWQQLVRLGAGVNKQAMQVICKRRRRKHTHERHYYYLIKFSVVVKGLKEMQRPGHSKIKGGGGFVVVVVVLVR
jgi:hypothetical protein